MGFCRLQLKGSYQVEMSTKLKLIVKKILGFLYKILPFSVSLILLKILSPN